MKEFVPFSRIEPSHTAPIPERGSSEDALELFPMLMIAPQKTGAVRDFRPQAVEEVQAPPVVETSVEVITPEGDADPKDVTSSVIDNVHASGSVSESTSMLMHPSTQSPELETPVSVGRESSQLNESEETTNSGFPLPLALG